MNFRKFTCIIACALLWQNYSSAQDKLNIKFRKITPADFDLSKYKFDTSASAVIIADIGNTSFAGNTKNNFTLVFKRFARIKILNKNGYNAAVQEISLYNNGENGDELYDLRASTFNLVNGKVTETKLEEKSVFTDKIDKYYSVKKFALPGVKEGSVIDISYTIKSDYYNYLWPWNFQGQYPCLWSEYEVIIPRFFNYIFMKHGDQNYFINTTKNVSAFYSIGKPVDESNGSDIYEMKSAATDTRWVMKNIPVLKEENFTSSLKNYVSGIEFQLHYVQYSDTSEKYNTLDSYFIASEKLLKKENFGAELDKENDWMNAELDSITNGCSTSLQKMKKIYAYIRDNFTCTEHEGIYTNNDLQSVFNSKNGNIAEINLLLVAMLRHENIVADPVLLSTRENGYASDFYPLISRFNYVICTAKDNGLNYMLDASWPKLSFGKLANDCYNGGAIEINKEQPNLFFLNTDSLKESKVTSLVIQNDNKNAGVLGGTFTSVLGNMESYNLREQVSDNSQEDFFNNIRSFNSDYIITNTGIDSLTQLDMAATIRYDFSYKISSDDSVVYFNPMISDVYKENPFKAEERKYPVEMSYLLDAKYMLNMEIPKGYVVDELPESAKISLNENDGSFEYTIEKDAFHIHLLSQIKLNKATFQPEDYSKLRDFFAFIVKKQSEQIVFKKRK